LLFLLFLLSVLAPAWAEEPVRHRDAVPEPGSLECDEVDPCELVLPGAVRFERPAGKPYAAGYDADGELVGWVVLSNDVVDIKAYSGKPMSTLVGLDPEGAITGGRVVHHSEPILLVGIPEQKLHDFVDAYAGVKADEPVVVGQGAAGSVSVDGVSGATVTVLAQNQTILGAARALAQDVGVLEARPVRPGHFVTDRAPLTWAQMVQTGALGNLRVEAAEMHETGPEPFLDLYFGLVDAPHVGIPLLGEHVWRQAMDDLRPGEHLFVAFNRGTTSFKGSGFVRGGIFDRFRVEQGLTAQTFRDLDYANVGHPIVADAPPDLREGGLFVTRDGNVDPGAPYRVVFIATVYDTSKGAFNRDFRSFEVSHTTPSTVYELEGMSAEMMLVVGAWTTRMWRTGLLVAFLGTMVGLFSVGRRWLTASTKRLKRIHIIMMILSVVVLGMVLRAQPSITQLLTLIGGAAGGEFRWSLFLSDPLLFLSWIFIAGILFVWGRGVFCGWTCPYGSLSELIFKASRALRIPEFEVPLPVHHVMRYGRYLVLIGLVVAFLIDAQVGEQLAEIEPFKTTWFVTPWLRHPALFGWWVVLLLWSVFTWRPFCQYMCPLGGALAIPSYVRISGPKRRDFCSKCKICTKTCEPRAIDKNGVINGADCLNCMECEANFYDDQTCPPLVKIRRDKERKVAASRPAASSPAK
jgi:NosR/NirI family nitrous oxide reductase transcriptional regulator